MKKLFLTLIVGTTVMTAGAETYLVRSGNTEGTQIPTEWGWNERMTVSEPIEDETAPFGKYWRYTAEGGGWSIYGDVNKQTEFDVTLLKHSNMYLVFNARCATDVSTWAVKWENQTQGKAHEVVFDLTRDGQWHEVKINLKETYPDAYNALTTGDKLFVFMLVAKNSAGGDVVNGDCIDVADVHYETIGEETEDPVNPDPVDPTIEGNTWYGHIDNDGIGNRPISVDYSLTANANGSATINASFSGNDAYNTFNPEFWYEGTLTNMTKGEDGTFTGTVAGPFKKGQALPAARFRIVVDGGVIENGTMMFSYNFDDANEKPVVTLAPALTASAEEITSDSAKIAYTVSLPAALTGAEVTVYMDNEIATASPIQLSGLEAKTEYAHTLKAVATLDGNTYEGKDVEVKFTTLRNGAQPYVWHAIADGVIGNAYLIGEDPNTDRRDIAVSFPATVTYNTDETISVEVAFKGDAAKIAGLVPKMTVSSNDYKFEYRDMAAKGEGVYSITTDTKYPMDHNIGWLFVQFAYDGGATTVNINGYSTGLENDKVSYGEPKEIRLTHNAKYLKVGDSFKVSALVVDENNHYLLDNKVAITVDGSSLFFENDTVTAIATGESILKATSGELSSEEPITVWASQSANMLTPGSFCSDGTNPANAFDDNEGTLLEWGIADTEEHYLYIDYGQEFLIEAIHLVWEGASAQEFTVTLTNNRPAEFDQNAPQGIRAAADEETSEDKVFEFKDQPGMQTVRNSFSTGGAKARYMLINTHKASTGYGIKLFEARVQGSVNDPNSVSAIEDENAPVEYFTVSGVRLNGTPESGLYIRRQGQTVTKVLVK